MKQTFRLFSLLCAAAIFGLLGCGGGDDKTHDTNGDSDTSKDTGSGSDLDADSDGDADSDSNTGADSDTDSDTADDTDSSTDSNSDSDSDTDTSVDHGKDCSSTLDQSQEETRGEMFTDTAILAQSFTPSTGTLSAVALEMMSPTSIHSLTVYIAPDTDGFPDMANTLTQASVSNTSLNEYQWLCADFDDFSVSVGNPYWIVVNDVGSADRTWWRMNYQPVSDSYLFGHSLYSTNQGTSWKEPALSDFNFRTY